MEIKQVKSIEGMLLPPYPSGFNDPLFVVRYTDGTTSKVFYRFLTQYDNLIEDFFHRQKTYFQTVYPQVASFVDTMREYFYNTKNNLDSYNLILDSDSSFPEAEQFHISSDLEPIPEDPLLDYF